MRKLKHSKKRNLGLVYEFLTREVSAAVVAKDTSRAATALRILGEHLGPDSDLHEEVSLHRSVMESRGVGEALARKIVDELKAAGIRMGVSSAKRESAKSALIHEMNRELGRDVFDRWRIPDYTAHASVYLVMSRGIGSRLDESVDMARVEEHLVEFLRSPAVAPPAFDRDSSMYAYRTAVDMFQREYGAELTAEQSDLLREYVRVSLGGNPAPLSRTLERQRSALTEFFRLRRSDEVFRSDPDMAARLDEAVKELASLDPSSEESVERMMLFHNLKREVES